jgi:dihydrofolate synthase/folylpolyglutamate synthase
MTLGLGNMRQLLRALDHPEKRFRSVLVAGTNGKGSVTAYLSAILKNSGMRVGWYSSPHVYQVTERIRVDGSQITLEEMEEAAARVAPLHKSIGYSYFEALTAIAFLVFADRGVELGVLETGLGGRFDATNVVEPEVCVLTHVGLDHRRILGDTEEEILREKLGITRPETPFLVGPLGPNLMEMVAEKARHDRIPFTTSDELGTIELDGLSFSGMRARIRTCHRDYGTVRLPFAGEHQLANALLAVGAAERIVGAIGDLDSAADHADMPGRFEVQEVSGKHVIFDVAHNDDGLIAAARTLAALSPSEKNAMILGVLNRKELIDFPRVVSRWIGRLCLVQPASDEWLAAPSMLDRIGLENVRDGGLEVVLQSCLERDADWDRFLDRLLDAAVPHDALLITGSHRTVELFGRRLLRRIQ